MASQSLHRTRCGVCKLPVMQQERSMLPCESQVANDVDLTELPHSIVGGLTSTRLRD